MSICLGFIPNENTVMILQDSERTIVRTGLGQKSINKIEIKKNAVIGCTGMLQLKNEIIENINFDDIKNFNDLKINAENAYHKVREDRFKQTYLKKYGYESLHDKKMTREFRKLFNEVLYNPNSMGNENYMNSTLMIASCFDKPCILIIDYPGKSDMSTSLKSDRIFGIGAENAVKKIGEIMENAIWEPSVSEKDSIDFFVRIAIEAEKYHGVGGPFHIAYINKKENAPVPVDSKKLNMAIYLKKHNFKKIYYKKALDDVLDRNVSSCQLYKYIVDNADVGKVFKDTFSCSLRKYLENN